MCFFLNASKFVSVPILSEWLTLEGLIDLDSALCNNKARCVFFKLLEEFPQVLKDKLSFLAICPSPAWVDWTRSRGFKSSSDRLVFRNKTLNQFDDALDTLQLAECFNGTKKIEIDRMTAESEASFVKLLLQCPNLANITITNSLDINSVIALLAMNGTRLTSLCLTGCWKLVDSVMVVLLRQCVNVTDLDLSNCYQLTSVVMRTMAIYCRKIQRFNMQAFSMLNVTRDTLILIHHNFLYGQLTHFIMSRINNPIVKSLVWYCGASLVELDYANSYYLNMDSICYVPQCCPRLTRINTSYCYTLPDSSVRDLSVLPGLSSIDLKDLYHLSNKTVTALASRYSSLCLSPTGVPFAALAEVIFYSAPSVSNETIVLLSRLCSSSLTSLTLSTMQITDATAIELCLNLSGGRLKLLGLSSNPVLTPDALTQCLLHVGHSLNSLKLSMLPLLSDVTLENIAQSCYQLTSLEMSNNDHITDQGVDVLSSACRDLTHLSVSQCKNITSATLHSIARYLRRSITYLNVINCHTITGEAMVHFIRCMPRLRTLKTSLTRTMSFKQFSDVYIHDT